MDKALADIGFLERIQRSFNPSEMTEGRLKEWILHSKGKHKVSKGEGRTETVEPSEKLEKKSKQLVERLSKTKDVSEELENVDTKVKEADSIKPLIDLRNRIKEAPTHKDRLTDIYEKNSEEAIENRVSSLEDIGKLKKLKSNVQEAGFSEKTENVDDRIKTVFSGKLSKVTSIKEAEKIETKGVKGLKEEKNIKLKNLETRKRLDVRDELINNIKEERDVSESEAEKIVNREKLVTERLGKPEYTF